MKLKLARYDTRKFNNVKRHNLPLALALATTAVSFATNVAAVGLVAERLAARLSAWALDEPKPS